MDGFIMLGRFFRRLVGINAFDPEACIAYLLDKTHSEANRGAAAESLGMVELDELGTSVSRAVDALFQVACDQEDLINVREEAAGSLGVIWSEIGVDHLRFAHLPNDMKIEVLASAPAGAWTAGLPSIDALLSNERCS
jgi:hypothetical protein